ncbi:Ppx/GppA family phosphatase [bacterium]|nr:Ppx/GppA family phosphatase [bacterium]
MEKASAAIDLGTNTARLLIGSIDSGPVIRPLAVKRVVTRLGGGFTRETGISGEARERTLAALREFAADMRRHAVDRVRAVATSAVRDAVNGRAFADAVFSETGIRLEIIDGQEEALLTLRGVVSGLGRKEGDFLVFDIGGGSTEYTLARGTNPRFTRSLPLGVVRLTEGKGAVPAMEEKISRELGILHSEMVRDGHSSFPAGATLVGTAGSVTTLAALDMELTPYDPLKVQGYVLSMEAIRRIFDRLLPLTPEQRLLLPGMEKGREDLIVAGILITLKTMELFGFDSLTVSDTGILEGILLSLRGDGKG